MNLARIVLTPVAPKRRSSGAAGHAGGEPAIIPFIVGAGCGGAQLARGIARTGAVRRKAGVPAAPGFSGRSDPRDRAIIPYSTFLGGAASLRRRTASISSASGDRVADGAIIAVRMSEHTANPGQVYCAAGSLDEGDVVEGRCDLLGNMLREVREETGLELSADDADGRLFCQPSAATGDCLPILHDASPPANS